MFQDLELIGFVEIVDLMGGNRVAKLKKPTLTFKELSLLPNHKQIRFAIFCANQVIHLVPTEHMEVCLKAINAAELYLEGKASKEECGVAANTTYTAAYAAAANAAANAASAANAAYAASTAANAASAANAAYAASTAAYAASTAAANAANAAAAYAASPKEKQNIIEAQYHLYDQLLNEDRIFEEIVLNSETKYIKEGNK